MWYFSAVVDVDICLFYIERVGKKHKTGEERRGQKQMKLNNCITQVLGHILARQDTQCTASPLPSLQAECLADQHINMVQCPVSRNAKILLVRCL